jgi:hypothetical protein
MKKICNIIATVFFIFIILSTNTLTTCVKSKPTMKLLNEIENQKIKVNDIFNNDNCDLKIESKLLFILKNIFQKGILNKGLFSWLIELLQQLIEMLKNPFERLKSFFNNMSGLFNKLAVLMEDIILLLDWLVRQVITAVIISILISIIDFILYILEIIQGIDEEPVPNFYHDIT